MFYGVRLNLESLFELHKSLLPNSLYVFCPDYQTIRNDVGFMIIFFKITTLLTNCLRLWRKNLYIHTQRKFFLTPKK